MVERFLSQTSFSSQEDFNKNLKINVPENFNFGYDVVDAWAAEQPDKNALLWTNDKGESRQFSFADMKRSTDMTASYFQSLGIGRGDMVMLILKRRYEFWYSTIAFHKLGATVIPATHLLTKKDIIYRCNAADIQREKYKSDISHHEERLAMQGLSRQEAMERRREGSLKELHDKVASLKGQITALGTINPAAEDEYKTALEKRDFYNRQCDDLKESREKLRTVVAEIDAAMAEQFAKAFKEIGVHFQDIFSRLFGGGTAHPALTDKEHILEAGVEIYIRPPGKKQQSLTLLSGGERALTVIALLLAFLAYHPAPFCLVDEVDAALDEANVERMARYLKNYSGATQFIVITHRRKTMEAANTLLGVTMEEKGVSRLLTVKVDELLKEGT